VSLDDLRDQISRGAHMVTDALERVREEIDETRVRHQMDHEMDLLFQELGIEVYQRMAQGEPVEDSVVVQDLVDRLAEVEARLEAVRAAEDEESGQEEPGSSTTDAPNPV
jgi:hypothetical protein